MGDLNKSQIHEDFTLYAEELGGNTMTEITLPNGQNAVWAARTEGGNIVDIAIAFKDRKDNLVV